MLGRRADPSGDYFHCWCHNENILCKIVLHANEVTTHFKTMKTLNLMVVINLVTSFPKCQRMSVLFGLLSVIAIFVISQWHVSYLSFLNEGI